jgi:hypothetical protein
MKYILTSLIVGALLCSCATDDLTTYHSHAFVKRNVRSTQTKMQLQKCVNDYRGTHDVGVVAALDVTEESKEQRYLLIVPKGNQSNYTGSITDYRINRGAVLQLDDVPRLTDLLKSLVANWDVERSAKEALLWEFSTDPKYSEIKLADSVAFTFPSLTIYASSFENGIGIIMILSEHGRTQSIEIDDKEKIECLINAIERGVTKANELKL